MSTGSSDSGASSVPSDTEVAVSPLSPGSELQFRWPHYSLGSAAQSSPTEHRSVSQAGDHETHNTSIARSDVYVKMNPVSPVFSHHVEGSPYMNLLYDAVQRQGGSGSVETAMSPYLEMSAAMSRTNVRNLKHTSIDTVSAIYAQIESSAVSQVSDTGARPPGLPRGRRPSTGAGKQVMEFRQLMQEVERKRHFRVGLNLFNTNPDIGIDYLVKQNFLELVPLSIAKFLYSTPSLAKEKVGEYLGHTQSAFCMKVLSVFMEEFKFTGLRIDKALRQLLTYVKVPSEAAKIEKIMEVFGKRYNKCNPNFASKLRSSDSVMTLAFAIMLLNTDLHNTNVKTDKKIVEKEFMNNLKSADDGKDFDSKLLKLVYKGIKKEAFSCGIDHVAQTKLLQSKISGKAPSLAASHRRLVCLVRLAEVIDIQTKVKSEATNHERDIWLFNDTMVLTKVVGQEKGNAVYGYRDSFPLKGMEVTLFHTPVFQFGIQVCRKTDSAVLATLNAVTEQDRYKFVMDLQESIFEMDLMERALREANMIK